VVVEIVGEPLAGRRLFERMYAPATGRARAQRVVIVSNRVPAPGADGARAGGLAVALADAVKPGDLWFGWSGQIAGETGGSARRTASKGVDYATIDLSQQDYDRFYVGFANGTLWPLLHFRPGLLTYERTEYEAYMAVNRAYARALQPLLKPNDLIWVHDYQLIPLALALRALGVTNRIGFFLHVPFVPASVLETLPGAVDLLTALCAYDVAGFQTARNVEDFRDCVRRMLGVESAKGRALRIKGHSVLPIACPIGIDVKGFAHQAARAAKGRETKRLTDSLVGRKLIIGVDRLDYSKGLPERFEGYSRLLSRFPEHRNAVSYLQVAARSREDVMEYKRLKQDLDRKAGEVNGRYAEYDWAPLRYITRPIARRTLAGFYQIARVALVTPLQDGMNLVAKEFVAAQAAEDPGVLVLSAFAGAAEQLTEALIVNPHDADAITEAIHSALTMPLPERRARHEALYKKINETSAEAYCNRFLAALARTAGTEPLWEGASR
jgi:trehalose 6-phosphate synthase